MTTSKLTMLAVLFSVALFGLAAPASADGQFCIKLDPFIDTVKLSFHPFAGENSTFGRWQACGVYSMAVTGAISPTGDGTYRLTAHGTHNTGFFGGFKDCAIDGTIGGPMPWPWLLECGGFTNSGSISIVACPANCLQSGAPAGTPAGQ